MKLKILSVLFFILSTVSSLSQASTVICRIDKNNALLFESALQAHCDNYIISIDGIGLGLFKQFQDLQFGTSPAGIALQCVANDNPIGNYYGVKATAGVFIVNTDVGVFVGKSGVCILGGLGTAAIGGAIDGAKLTISEQK